MHINLNKYQYVFRVPSVKIKDYRMHYSDETSILNGALDNPCCPHIHPVIRPVVAVFVLCPSIRPVVCPVRVAGKVPHVAHARCNYFDEGVRDCFAGALRSRVTKGR